jgi:hypothetical protein
MANNQTCPPIPTLDELLNSGNFIEVDVDELVPSKIVVLMKPSATNPETKEIHCVNILNKSNGYIEYIYIGDKYRRGKADFSLGDNEERLIRMGYKFFRKVNPRKNFDDVTTETEERIRNYPINQQLTSAETIFANKELSDNIGKFLGPSTSGKGGRRKRRGTKRRTRKNKRKSTRRVRRKYKR